MFCSVNSKQRAAGGLYTEHITPFMLVHAIVPWVLKIFHTVFPSLVTEENITWTYARYKGSENNTICKLMENTTIAQSWRTISPPLPFPLTFPPFPVS